MNIVGIEESLSKAQTIVFHFPFIVDESPYVKLTFENPAEEGEVYEYLTTQFPKAKWTLVIYDREAYIDICMIDDSDGTMINVKNLSFDTTAFTTFKRLVPTDSALLFTIGHQGTLILPSRGSISLFFGKYTVIS